MVGMCLAGDPEEEEPGTGASQAGEAARAKLLRKTQAQKGYCIRSR